jgi:WD40 repeat protein
VGALAFSPDGRTLATVSGSSQFVTFWDALSGTESGRIGGRGSRVVAFEFSPDGAHLATLDDRGAGLVWKTAAEEAAPVAELLPGRANFTPATLLAFSPTNGRLVTASPTGVNWWDDPTRGAWARRGADGYRVLPQYTPEIVALRYTPDGAKLLVGRRDLEIWDAEKMEAATVLQTNKGGLRSITVAPDGERAAVSLKNTVRVCKLAKPAWETTLHWGRDMVYAVAFSRDGRALLTAGADGTVRFWEVGTWQETRSFDWGIGKIHVVAFSPDGLTCAAGGENGQVVVWDVDT